MLKQLATQVLKAIIQLPHLPIGHHIVNGLFIRFLLIIYAHFHDAAFDVKYTDVDYKVFTDAARHVMKGQSPFERHTYRYSPIIAWLMLPNIFFSENFGKVLFSVIDIIISLEIRSYVMRQLRGKGNAAKIAKYSSLFWLYNPLSIVISTRGSADSVTCLTILMSLSLLHSHRFKNLMKYVLSGFFLGLSIHLRIYPIIFSLPMYLALGEYKITRNTPIGIGLISLFPNKKQVTLAISTVVTLVALTYGMYLLYGYQFIFETYIYHFFRKDTRHNFSVFFYTSYLTTTDPTFDMLKFTARIFMISVLFLLSFAFGCDVQTLPFALFCQAAVLVTYNSVVTSQYFIWYLSLLPLVVHDIRVRPKEVMFLITMWTGGQFSWLFYAYALEFQNEEVFIILWAMCVLFFVSNIIVLYQFIRMYLPGYSFGILNTNARMKNK